jgi:methylenetetrahydrofolate dehydrogenase (NADP+) / methenyltetrahydrofolate cyclohydrolase
VTVAHSKTRDLPVVCRRVDLAFAAIGPSGAVDQAGRDGHRRRRQPVMRDGKQRVVDIVAFEEAREVAGAFTPVPGGVGPMTIACLLANTVRAACMSAGLPVANL